MNLNISTHYEEIQSIFSESEILRTKTFIFNLLAEIYFE
jgi:hypothetical protein